jgi:hypothetical protein
LAHVFWGDAVSFLGEIEQFVADDLYPHRWPITIGLLLAVAAAVVFGYMRGWHLVAWKHKLVSALVAVAVLAVTIPAGDYFLSPLWERSFLEEASPLETAASVSKPDTVRDAALDEGGDTGDVGSGGTAGSGASGSAVTPNQEKPATADDGAIEFAPGVVASGEFEGADDFHFGRGQALLIETAPDVYTLRFEGFSVRNGPDLFVYLSQDPDGYTSDALELGRLKATDGSFNYEVPAGTDVSQFKSAIVWCKPFSVLFAAASLVNA